ncbi:hypothetical protein C0Q70_05817 [Pomacea canaliculata]|uniref:G-protein coupled receptors family 2 profile 1 domain-containing protein n=1 Tax=Pomacea canaliculata TaxID=400727 RepID=A0A2T7PMB6_POMCA|nr:hypothetical protein C0Q70_05817 [Pomacea canaliculata]
MPNFACIDGIRTLPFTLVCDHRYDCLDNSDEEFCVHRQCSDSTCKASAECIPYSAWCDGMQHCTNGLDEVKCFLQPRPAVSRLPPPAVVNLDGYGNFTQQPLLPNQTCPPTHFRCADLSDNHIETVDMEIFHGLKNLRILRLSNNPLTSVTGAVSSFDHLYLMQVDLSVTQLVTFDTKPFSNFTNIRNLNLSYTPIESIGPVAFSETANLEVLDSLALDVLIETNKKGSELTVNQNSTHP